MNKIYKTLIVIFILAVNTILASCLFKSCFYFYKMRLITTTENGLILNTKNTVSCIFIYFFVYFLFYLFYSCLRVVDISYTYHILNTNHSLKTKKFGGFFLPYNFKFSDS